MLEPQDECQVWISRMSVDIGILGGVPILDLKDRCQYWISRMGVAPNGGT